MRFTRPGAEAAASGATPNVARNNAEAFTCAGLTRVRANATLRGLTPPRPAFLVLSGDTCMRPCARSALWLLLAGVPALLHAQGFGIYEQGTCAMGRAGTGVAAPCADGSAMYPARRYRTLAHGA